MEWVVGWKERQKNGNNRSNSSNSRRRKTGAVKTRSSW